VSTGVRDFFVAPAQGLVLGPTHFARGIGAGTSSLLRNLTLGLSASAFSVTDSLGAAVAAASFDEAYVNDRRNRAKDRPSNVLSGALYGARDLSAGIYRGVTGVVTK
jgi:vacuolar protein sorting-associated protein 13A/C